MLVPKILVSATALYVFQPQTTQTTITTSQAFRTSTNDVLQNRHDAASSITYSRLLTQSHLLSVAQLSNNALPSKVMAYVPIISISSKLEKCKESIDYASTHLLDSAAAKRELSQARDVLLDPIFEPPAFKKTFNRYADNIVVTGDASVLGQLSPTSIQTELYLLRNQILTEVQNTKDDVIDALSHDVLDPQDVADALDDISSVLRSVKSYMDLSDPADVALAKTIFEAGRKNEINGN